MLYNKDVVVRCLSINVNFCNSCEFYVVILSPVYECGRKEEGRSLKAVLQNIMKEKELIATFKNTLRTYLIFATRCKHVNIMQTSGSKGFEVIVPKL
jgi:hypothetical protein